MESLVREFSWIEKWTLLLKEISDFVDVLLDISFQLYSINKTYSIEFLKYILILTFFLQGFISFKNIFLEWISFFTAAFEDTALEKLIHLRIIFLKLIKPRKKKSECQNICW